MADMNFKLDFTDKAKLKESFDSIVKFAELVSSLIKNETVDKVVHYFKEVAQTDWFLELVIFVAKLFERKDVSAVTLSVS
jgi:hypothetical protein